MGPSAVCDKHHPDATALLKVTDTLQETLLINLILHLDSTATVK